MTDIIFLFFCYFLIVFSIIGYGKLFRFFSLKKNNSDIEGLFGLLLLIIISYLTNLYFKHGYVHNIIVISFGLIIFLKYLKESLKDLKIIISIFSILFIGLLMYKNHDDFYYYHFQYTLTLINFNKIFGLGLFNHGFRTPSSIFYLNSLFYFPFIKYFLLNAGAIYLLGFSNFILLKKIVNYLKLKKTNFIFFLIIFTFIYVNTAFYRIAEHGTDKSALILIFLLAIYYFESINLKTNFSPNNIIYSFEKLIILLILIISLKSFYLIYIIFLFLWIFELRKNIFSKKIILKFLTNRVLYLFITGLILVIFTVFSNTGCLVYPASFTCNENLQWSIPLEEVQNMKLWYEQWSKSGASPNFRVDNPEIYVSDFNWVSRWFQNYFFTKVSDSFLIIITISFILFLFYFDKENKKNKVYSKYKIFYFFLILLIIEWFVNHPALRYGGYTLFALCFFIPISLYLEKLDFKKVNIKKRTLMLILITLIIFLIKNIDRINTEYKKYEYNILSNPYFYLNENRFVYDKKLKKIDKKNNKHFLILNYKTIKEN